MSHCLLHFAKVLIACLSENCNVLLRLKKLDFEGGFDSKDSGGWPEGVLKRTSFFVFTFLKTK